MTSGGRLRLIALARKSATDLILLSAIPAPIALEFHTRSGNDMHAASVVVIARNGMPLDSSVLYDIIFFFHFLLVFAEW